VAGTRLAFHVTRELHPARFGLLEPAADSPEALPQRIDVFVVPGLGFDARGARLGYGKGFYDSALAAAPRALRIGVAFDCQIVHEIPEHAGDQRVDVIVTETGARWTGARPGRTGT
jgi:5-formyltetrahydrofolate cyclo-ligase